METIQTTADNLAKELKCNAKIILKREDLHKYGSHKGRSIPKMIKKHHQDGWSNFVISSSGNAAVAAIMSINEHNINYPNDQIALTVFAGKKIDPEKMKKIVELIQDEKNIKISQIENPKQQAFQIDKAGTAKFLRQSTDDSALQGYDELADELAQITDLQAIFIPTSSGTTAQGIYDGFQKTKTNPQIHIVQTTLCHPFVVSDIVAENHSLAGAIVDKIGHRKKQVAEIIEKTKGQGWIATNKDIEKVIELVKKTENIDISPNSALAVTGLTKAIQQGNAFDGTVVCLITGK